ncbi:MAG: rhomboid family intramembrane serine protease [Candidatus Zhuqueibacterota bacterium]
MFPLRDTIPSATFPFVTLSLIVMNGLVFLLEIALGEHISAFINFFGIIPARYFFHLTNGINVVAMYFPLLSSQFLHGSWFHLIGNLWFLWIFGDNVEDHIGHTRFLIFYLFCGAMAGLAHIYTNPGSNVPTVGASGAIAGVMGAYVFLFPRARVTTFIPIFFLVEMPAYLFLGIWFLLQSFSGVSSLAANQDCCGVAWWAHIGGFILGALIALVLFPRRKKKRYWVTHKTEVRDYFDY